MTQCRFPCCFSTLYSAISKAHLPPLAFVLKNLTCATLILHQDHNKVKPFLNYVHKHFQNIFKSRRSVTFFWLLISHVFGQSNCNKYFNNITTLGYEVGSLRNILVQESLDLSGKYIFCFFKIMCSHRHSQNQSF